MSRSRSLPPGLTNIPTELDTQIIHLPSYFTLKVEFSILLFNKLPQQLSSQFSSRLISLLNLVRTTLPLVLTHPPLENFHLPPDFFTLLNSITSTLTVMLSTLFTTITLTSPSQSVGQWCSELLTMLHTVLYVNTPSNLSDLLRLLIDFLTHPPVAQPYSELTSFPAPLFSFLSNILPLDLHPLAELTDELIRQLLLAMHRDLMSTLSELNMPQWDDMNSSPLAPYDLEQLTVQHVYQARKDAKSDPDKCSICLEEMKDGDNARRLGCSHTFHLQCIDRWLETKTSCPLCRTPIDATRD